MDKKIGNIEIGTKNYLLIEKKVDQLENQVKTSILQVDSNINEKINKVQTRLEIIDNNFKEIQKNNDEKMNEIQKSIFSIITMLENKELSK